ncbi:MAG: hypothetical protein HN617_16100 [Planctomycetaceae bacterium]|nr:hypothetical protein [Planctomycetaceae bacterium]
MRRFTSYVLGLALVLAGHMSATACPFCAATTQTFTEEMSAMDSVVFAELVKLPPPIKPGTRLEEGQEIPRASFKIVKAVKGSDLVKIGQMIEAIYFGEAKIGSVFLVMGVDPPNVAWSTPLQVSATTQAYIEELPNLPTDAVKRLVYFQKYLEHKEEALARDAYDEFAKTPYDVIRALKSNMNHDQLVTWVSDENIPASRRRLYLTLLGICGTQADLPMLETLLKSGERRKKAGLDALIGCYLTLRGEEGMPLIEDLFIKNKKSEYADTYAAIMALRFHGTESDVIPRKRILEAMRYMLERPQLADLVIPDLARWEDWSQVDRLVKLFKDADEQTSWVRVPVVNYLRQCPLPAAKEQIKKLEKIDPAAIKRANTFFPVGPSGGNRGGETVPKSSSLQRTNEVFVSTQILINDEQFDDEQSDSSSIDTVQDTAIPTNRKGAPRQPRLEASTGELSQGTAMATDSNLWYALGVPFLAGLGLLFIQYRIMTGTND